MGEFLAVLHHWINCPIWTICEVGLAVGGVAMPLEGYCKIAMMLRKRKQGLTRNNHNISVGKCSCSLSCVYHLELYTLNTVNNGMSGKIILL
ncbi:hypothetical protein FRX31_017465 [Thalictrum thalictroides]|uniref:Uncharacterized protein n=1 Tax=Thalictrum thalictroides TaxID=46969 RepID=A0A7J6W7Z8_THATH|nr:hypothetical protein FRX31_017465 [Thalictrum thalictroides]